ncbi:hypothetical protein AYK86_02190 [Acinetobacter venetianus]|uniref:hypothetical protein n=1 Tax=Acinetobacter venetianus TaxID=52133 RepID=UPI0007758D02|nr:hypothetical protein [Acinetobacter venetianus]KXO85860.1 hypothetical protein AYK86_02190 [Acinetobacter venetianus]
MGTHGFCAGTLVHTEQGLVPIQEIKVGDMVLSSPKDSDKDVPTEYKRVTKTFKSPEKQRIIAVAIPSLISEYTLDKDYLDGHWVQSQQIKDLPRYAEKYIYCTANHPFWTQEKGWISAIELAVYKQGSFNGNTLINYKRDLISTDLAYTFSTPLLRTTIPELAVRVDRQSQIPSPNIIHNIIDFSSGKPVLLTNIPKLPAHLVEDQHTDWSQDHIHLPDNANDPMVKQFSAEQHFYINGDAYDYEQGRFKENEYGEYVDPNYDANWTIDEKEEDDRKYSENSYYMTIVYNFEVEEYSTYFIGEQGLWVHQ